MPPGAVDAEQCQPHHTRSLCGLCRCKDTLAAPSTIQHSNRGPLPGYLVVNGHRSFHYGFLQCHQRLLVCPNQVRQCTRGIPGSYPIPGSYGLSPFLSHRRSRRALRSNNDCSLNTIPEVRHSTFFRVRTRDQVSSSSRVRESESPHSVIQQQKTAENEWR
jgi:hypothetical protein